MIKGMAVRVNHKNSPTSRLFYQLTLTTSSLALLFSLISLGGPALQAHRFSTSLKWMGAGITAVILLAVLLATAILTWTKYWSALDQHLTDAGAFLRKLGFLNLLPVLAAAALFAILIYEPIPRQFDIHGLVSNTWVRMSILWLVGLFSAPFLWALAPSLTSAQALGGGLLAVGVIFKICGYIPDVSSYPLTLSWSEASRFYYGSLFFSKSLYALDLPWPFLHPSRYLLLSIPYLIQGLPIWVHRLWQVLLWVGLTGLAASLLSRRMRLTHRTLSWIFAAWAFLFIFQGPVYYHLLVCVCVVLAGFDGKNLFRSLVVVILASLWAGISRVNWFPVPAMLAIALYLLETPYNPLNSFWRYLRAPFLWAVAGVASALAAQAVYIALSRQPDRGSFGSSFTSDLLWYRLLPSPTYPPGILPMILLMTAPLLVLIYLNLSSRLLHPLRTLGLAAMSAVLFVGGLVVSTKIGGGSNTHNMDAYLLLVLLWGSYLWSGRAAVEETGTQQRIPWPVLAVAVLMPLYPLILGAAPFVHRDNVAGQVEVAALQRTIAPVTQRGGRVLFIWQRQLVTFGLVSGVKLEPDYETVDLMEMAMSNNRPYLDHFEDLLRQHTYDLIVVDRQVGGERGPDSSFPEENNVWVQRVTLPMLKYYKEKLLLNSDGIQVLEPK